MERIEIIENILKFEKKYRVEEWTVDNIHIWPIIRLELFFSLAVNNNKLSQKSRKRSMSVLLKNLLYTFIFFVKRYKAAKVVFVGAESHRINFKNSSYNRYLDPLLDHLVENQSTNSYIIEYRGDITKTPLYYKPHRVIEIFRLFYIINIFFDRFGTIYWKRTKVHLPSYSEFQNEAKLLGFKTDGLLLERVCQKVAKIKLYNRVFEHVFSKIGPDVCVQLCYYNTETLSLNLAAYRKGVISIDMQHGTQGPLHIAYTKWGSIPNHGYELLPKIFWCWDMESYRNINAWSQTTRYHSAIIGGNPWVDFILNNNTFDVGFLPKNIVLYTMQPTGELLEDYIINAIVQSSSKFSWFLRLHPRQKERKQELEEKLAAYNISQFVNIQEATELPLPILLKHSCVHITKFSGATIEAASLGTPTILMDEIGTSTFADLIDKGLAFLCIEKEQAMLLKTITEVVGTNLSNPIDIHADSLVTIDNLLKTENNVG